MTDLLLVGDSHGNSTFIVNCINLAAELGVAAMLQLGDFGYWPPTGYAKMFSTFVNDRAKKAGVAVWAIDGNHDFPDDYHKRDTVAPNTERSGLQHPVRGTVITLAGRTIGFLGGAVSIDQSSRVTGKSWWPEEILSEADVAHARKNGTALDIMFSHDAPMPPIFERRHFNDRVQAAQLEHDPRFVQVLEHWRPRLHVHGHWHYRYSCPSPWGMRYGLDCESMANGVAVLNLEDMSLR